MRMMIPKNVEMIGTPQSYQSRAVNPGRLTDPRFSGVARDAQ
jgi:hypothetical protein